MGALEAVYREAYTSLRHRAFLTSAGKDFRVLFKPYAGLRSTIYQRPNHYEVRLADMLQKAPLQVHYSLACILIAKIDRRLKISRSERLAYESWSRDPSVIETHESLRKERGIKFIESPRGQTHDLTLLFHKLNREYFNALLPRVRIGYSKERSRSLWGHHDSAHETIVINKILDSPRVPEYVVESIVYHEMLHHVVPIEYGKGGRRLVHSRRFREAEKLFAHYEASQKFLRDVAHRKIRL
jgi:hypothetical protein